MQSVRSAVSALPTDLAGLPRLLAYTRPKVWSVSYSARRGASPPWYWRWCGWCWPGAGPGGHIM